MSEQVKLWIDEVVEDTVRQFTRRGVCGRGDLEALTNAMAALYQTEITAKELKEDLGEITRETLIEEFQTDARDEYEAKEEEFGSELCASSSASSSSRSSTSAGASISTTWTTPRGHRAARDGAEGSARRVHRGRRARLHRAQPFDPQRGRAPPLPRRARARAGAAGARAAAAAATAASRTSTRRPPARRRSAAAAGTRSAPPVAVQTGGSRQARSQRSLLVRVGQEVQEVPRRLTRDVRHAEVVTAASAGRPGGTHHGGRSKQPRGPARRQALQT